MMDCFVEKGGGGEEVRIIVVLYVRCGALAFIYCARFARLFFVVVEEESFF